MKVFIAPVADESPVREYFQTLSRLADAERGLTEAVVFEESSAMSPAAAFVFDDPVFPGSYDNANKEIGQIISGIKMSPVCTSAGNRISINFDSKATNCMLSVYAEAEYTVYPLHHEKRARVMSSCRFVDTRIPPEYENKALALQLEMKSAEQLRANKARFEKMDADAWTEYRARRDDFYAKRLEGSIPREEAHVELGSVLSANTLLVRRELIAGQCDRALWAAISRFVFSRKLTTAPCQ